MTDEEMAFYRNRLLEQHEEKARERQLYAALNFDAAVKLAKMLKGESE